MQRGKNATTVGGVGEGMSPSSLREESGEGARKFFDFISENV